MAVPVNCHIHLPPNFSAFSSVSQAVEEASAQGIKLLGASNYYDHRVYHEFDQMARKAGIIPNQGIEIVCWSDELAEKQWKINDPGNPGKVYLCGKSLRGLFQPTPRAADLLSQIRQGDRDRMRRMTDLLSGLLKESGISLELRAEEIEEQVAARSGVTSDQVVLQERHLAQALQQALFASTSLEARRTALTRLMGVASKAPGDPVVVQNEVRSQLMKAGKPAYAPEQFISLSDALDLIRELDGVPCYPVVFDGMIPPSEFEQSYSGLAKNLKGLGINHVEFIPNRNSSVVLQESVKALTSLDMTVSAGTEHNTLEVIPLMPRCSDGSELPKECAEAFFQGACRLAEWQSPDDLEALLESNVN